MRRFSRLVLCAFFALSLSCVVVGPVVAQEATKVNPKDGAGMVLIPAGEFMMGDDDPAIKDFKANAPNNPRHKVTLSAYYIYKNLVTVGQYEMFCKETKRTMPPAPEFNADWAKKDHPMIRLSWDEAKAYCEWAGGALPTEAQWEKAARGTEGKKYPWGNTFDRSKLQCSKTKVKDAGGTAKVGSFPAGASPYGVLDMAGNVWEWCADWYDEGFCATPAASLPNPLNDATGPQKARVLRGGSWNYIDPTLFRSAFRSLTPPYVRVNLIGFRVAMTR